MCIKILLRMSIERYRVRLAISFRMRNIKWRWKKQIEVGTVETKGGIQVQ